MQQQCPATVCKQSNKSSPRIRIHNPVHKTSENETQLNLSAHTVRTNTILHANVSHCNGI